MLSERDQAIVLDRERGDTYQTIGARYGITHPRVMKVVKNAGQFVTQCALDLFRARAETRQDPENPQVCAYLIPYGPDYTLALAFADWLVAELRRKHDVEVKTETRRAHNGLALIMEDITNYGWGDR